MHDDSRQHRSRPPRPPGPQQTVGADRQLAQAVARLQRELEALRGGTATRTVEALATGILMERLRCEPAEATAQLSRLARDANRTRAEMASDIVGRDDAHGGTHGPRPATGPAESGGHGHRLAEAALISASDGDAAARAVLDQTAALHGAAAVALWALQRGGVLALAGQAGFTSAEAAEWQHIPPGLGAPAQLAACEGREVWPGSSAGATAVSSIGGSRVVHRVALPMGRSGRRLGALEIAWTTEPEPELTPALRHQLRALTDVCALAVDLAPAAGAEPGPAELSVLAAVLDPAMLLEPVLDRDDEVADFRILATNEGFTDPLGRPRYALDGASLLETYPVASQTGLFERLLRVHATGETFHDDRLPLVFGGEEAVPVTAQVSVGRTGGHLLLTWRLREHGRRLAALLQHAQRLGRIGGFEEDLIRGGVLWNSQLYSLYGLPPGAPPVPLTALPEHTHPDDAPAIRRLLDTVFRQRRPGSAVFRLVLSDGPTRHTRVVAEPVTDPSGLLIAVRGAYQDVSAQHWTEIALRATREQLADTEAQAADRHRLALRLQQAILPSVPPQFGATGLRAAVRYRPAVEDEHVGGDWYDAVLLPSEQVLLVVGDVAGHGVAAATGMVALRNALRGLAATGAGPGQLLNWLNTVALHLTDQVTATAVCGLYDPPTRRLRWARAGHPAPVLLRGSTAEPLGLAHGILLGAADEADYDERTEQLEAGDVLLMYTDGLIERRDMSDQESLEALLRAVGSPGEDLEEFADTLLARSLSDTADDTCLIAVQAGDRGARQRRGTAGGDGLCAP